MSAGQMLERCLSFPLQHRLRRLRWRLFGEEAELCLLAPLADPHRAFLDVGAHRGLYLEHAIGRFRSVTGLEPNPELFTYLAGCFSGRAEIRQIALSDRDGVLTLHVPILNGRPVLSRASLDPAANGPVEHEIVEVPVTTLDRLELPPLAFIKIDVEGHEGAVLRGARATLLRDHPRLLVEIEERHHPGGSAAVFADLAALGYRAFYLDPSNSMLRPLAKGELGGLQNEARAKAPTRARCSGYVNNFLFLHTQDREAFAHLRQADRLGDDGDVDA